MSTKQTFRLWSRKPGEEWAPRGVYGCPSAHAHILLKYARLEPDQEHEMRPAVLEVSDEPARFVRYAR